MPLLKTFGEVKTSRVLQVAASCADSDEFRSLVNAGTDILLQRGDWPGTVIPGRFLVRNGCVVWPRYFQRVRRINHCRMPLKVGTIWFDFINRSDWDNWSGAPYYNWGGSASPVGISNFARGAGMGSLISQGRVPTYNDVPSDTPRYIRAYPLCPADRGKTLTIFGLDGNGQPLMTLQPDGSYTQGVTITLANPWGQTAVYVQRIDAVLKDITQLNVPMYAYDPISNTMLDLAIYEPSETNPSYAKDRLFAPNHPNCKCEMTVTALIKLAFIPVIVDSDYVLVPSEMALKEAIQAVKYGENGDVQNKALFMQSAINELNMVMSNEIPIDQTPIDEGFEGSEFGLGLQSVL